MTAATTRACPKCSTHINSDSKFCPSCGAAVSGIFSGGGSALDGTAVLAPENVDTVFPLLQDATLGDYDIYGELGRGGMAAVYLALDLALNRKVAIKTMLPDLVSKTGMVDRFKREAQTAAALSHPHIIQIFSVKQTKSLVYFVMKYIEGRSLESVIVERGKLDVDLTRVILSQVGGALAFAHRKGVVHRDMKPANIMLEEDGWAIVTDFGIAKVQEAQNLTATGTAIGTPHYMSPEQFHNKAVTGASDQYSLGVVAYEMLAGKKPFDGGTYAEIITQHLFEQPPDLRSINPSVPENVVQVIKKMMAKDPAERYPDIDTAIHTFAIPTSKTEGDKIRTQMISLAKSGPQKKLRLSQPMSPIPVTKKAGPQAGTIAEPAPKTKAKRPRPEPEEKKSRAGLWAAIIVLMIVGAGGAAWKLTPAWFGRGVEQNKNVQNPPAQRTDSTTPANVANKDSVPTNVVAEKPAIDEAKIRDSMAKALSKHFNDSVKRASALAEKHRRDSAAKVAANTPKQHSTPAGGALLQGGPKTNVVANDPPKAAATGQGGVRLASNVTGATVYINGQVENLISSPR